MVTLEETLRAWDMKLDNLNDDIKELKGEIEELKDEARAVKSVVKEIRKNFKGKFE